MAITSNDSGTMITGEHIPVFRLMAIRSGLRIEANTGMRMGRGRKASVLAREALTAAGIKAPRNLAQLLEVFGAYVEEVKAATPNV